MFPSRILIKKRNTRVMPFVLTLLVFLTTKILYEVKVHMKLTKLCMPFLCFAFFYYFAKFATKTLHSIVFRLTLIILGLSSNPLWSLNATRVFFKQQAPEKSAKSARKSLFAQKITHHLTFFITVYSGCIFGTTGKMVGPVRKDGTPRKTGIYPAERVLNK